MITAETVNGIVRFEANGLPVVSLYCGVDPGESQRELRARVDSLLDQIRPLAKDGDFDPRHRLSVRADIAEMGGSAEGIVPQYQRDGPAVPGVVCDGSRWLAASGELCPVCGKHTRYTPDVLDELAAVVIGTGGSARQIAADLMSEEYLAAAELRFSPPPPDQGS